MRLKYWLRGAAILALLWAGSVLWFGANQPRAVADPDRVTDAIVVLTGGGERIGAGIELLEAGRGKKLLISGANQRAAEPTSRNLRDRSDRFDCCIVIEFEAADTAGNAAETALWMAGEGYSSLRIVTAAYHMPRSLLEFRRAMPGIELVPHPVFPSAVPREGWWRTPRAARLIAGESFKYWLAAIRARLIASPAERRPVRATLNPDQP